MEKAFEWEGVIYVAWSQKVMSYLPTPLVEKSGSWTKYQRRFCVFSGDVDQNMMKNCSRKKKTYTNIKNEMSSEFSDWNHHIFVDKCPPGKVYNKHK